MGNLNSELTQVQLDKYKECLIYVNNDLGMLLQNAENLAYKLGAIKQDELHYLSYDYYKQYKTKDIFVIRKNIISSLNFFKKQLIAIKQETGKEYILPPSIDQIKEDIKNWKKKVEKISPEDVKYYNTIISILEDRKYTEIQGWEEVYDKCKKSKESEATPYMWMNMSPPILNNIDKNVENMRLNNQSNPNFEPDINRENKNSGDQKLILSNQINKEIKEINRLLKEKREFSKIKQKISDYINKYECEPYIEESNKELYQQINIAIMS